MVRLVHVLFVVVLLLGGIGCNAALPEPESSGAQLYRQRCSGCHRLYAPSILTADMWKLMLARMELQIQRSRLPPLSADEQQTLLDYLQKHSNKASS
jgi:Dihaem cytochrome c